MKKYMLWLILAIVFTLGMGATSVGVGVQNSTLKNQNDRLSDVNDNLVDTNNRLNETNKELSDKLETSTNESDQLIKDMQDIIDQYGQTMSLVLFEVDGELYTTKMVPAGCPMDLPEITVADNLNYFLGWQINHQGEIYRGSYTVTQPTKFVAVMTKKAVVSFVDGDKVTTQYFKHGTEIELPTRENTTTTYYNGWKVDGEGESVTGKYTVKHDVTLVLDMAGKAVVNFFENDVISETRYVIHNDVILLPTRSDTATKYFNGWKVNGVGEALKGNYQVTQDTNFVINMENDPTVTYVVNGKVESTQSVKHGQTINLEPVPDNETQYYNGWKVNGEGIALKGEYIVTNDTVFVLDMINNPVVSYLVGDRVTETFYAKYGDVIELKTMPDTVTQYFNGWKVDGQGESLKSEYKVTADVNLVLDMVNKAEVKFLVDGKIDNTVFVKPGEVTTLPTYPDTELAIYNGWKVNGTGEAYRGTFAVTGDTTLVLDMVTDQTWVATDKFYPFSIFSGRSVWHQGENIYYSMGTNHYVLDKSTRNWLPTTWYGLTDFNGVYVWTDGTDYYYSNNTEQWVLNVATRTWSPVTWSGVSGLTATQIWSAGGNWYYSPNNLKGHYVLNPGTRTWSTKVWKGLGDLPSSYSGGVWTDGVDVYYSCTQGPNSFQYVLNLATDTWSKMTWNFDGVSSVAIHGGSVWTDGTKYYLSSSPLGVNYVLDVATHTWSAMDWNGLTVLDTNYFWTDGEHIYSSVNADVSHPYYATGNYILVGDAWLPIPFTGINESSQNPISKYIWTDGVDTYYSCKGAQFVINQETKQWELMVWHGFKPENGEHIWTDGNHYYYGSDYVLDTSINTWLKTTWKGLTNFEGKYVWSDGEKYYYSKGSTHYVLNTLTKTWSAMVWDINFDGNYVWTDGKNYYYSKGTTQYALDKANQVWTAVSWNGLSNFNQEYIWTDGNKYYYSEGTKQFVLDANSHTWAEITWHGVTDIYGNYVWRYQDTVYYTARDRSQNYQLNTKRY